MIAETISLGILSLPSVLAAIGIVPYAPLILASPSPTPPFCPTLTSRSGLILIIGLGLVATYTGYVIGQFKLAHPFIHNMADAGFVLLGRPGREIFGAAQLLLLVFIMGSHILTFEIMLNTLSSHGTCTIIFGIVGLVVCYLCTLPRKLGDVSHLAIASFISIIAAVVVTMAAVGTEKPGGGHIDATMQASLADAFLPVTNIVFAYAGHVAFFSFISELKRPEEYYKSLFLLQGVDTAMYLLVAGVIYAYAGENVTSPALGSSAPLFQKIAYGLAIPTIVVAGVINGHVAAKYIYVRMYRGTDMMSKKTFKSYGTWALISLLLWIVAWIIAEAIPVFNDLLGLISSLFSSWFTYGLSGLFWLHLHRGRWFESPGRIAMTVLNSVVVLIGTLIVSIDPFLASWHWHRLALILECGFVLTAQQMALGLYASGLGIQADSASGGGSFSCADNSKS
ncbi:MAG: hypothetical protein LQ340_003040 [Diploschistes diacapsis]|nr:MAG: hypothetical protein LQ340_003040 [Diploschistes diacapsis]